MVGEKFMLLSGDDGTFFEFMLLGGDGVISVTANLAAREIARVCQLITSKRVKEAREINDSLDLLHNKLFIESNPIPVKWACEKIGLIQNATMRLPMTPLSNSAIPEVEKALKLAKLL